MDDDADHDHKGFSEERCTRCGWVMGQPPLNCQNDDSPHLFPSQLRAILDRRELTQLVADTRADERDRLARLFEANSSAFEEGVPVPTLVFMLRLGGDAR